MVNSTNNVEGRKRGLGFPSFLVASCTNRLSNEFIWQIFNSSMLTFTSCSSHYAYHTFISQLVHVLSCVSLGICSLIAVCACSSLTVWKRSCHKTRNNVLFTSSAINGSISIIAQIVKSFHLALSSITNLSYLLRTSGLRKSWKKKSHRSSGTSSILSTGGTSIALNSLWTWTGLHRISTTLVLQGQH